MLGKGLNAVVSGLQVQVDLFKEAFKIGKPWLGFSQKKPPVGIYSLIL